MKKVNLYFKGFNGSDNSLDIIKYGLLNERGYDLDSSPKKYYNEEEITKLKVKSEKK